MPADVFWSGAVQAPSILIVNRDDDTRLMYRTVLQSVVDSIFVTSDGSQAPSVAGRTRPCTPDDLVETVVQLWQRSRSGLTGIPPGN
jgi:hypothetical protein